MAEIRAWQPYFRPTRKVHDSGYRCFECGYLKMGDGRKALKKVVVARGVDHIESANGAHMDLLRDGNIRVFRFGKRLFWSIPGFSDAAITDMESFADPSYDELDKMWEEQCKDIKLG